MHPRKILFYIVEKIAGIWLVASWDVVRQVRRPVFFLMRLAFAVIISGQFLWDWAGEFGNGYTNDGLIDSPSLIIDQVRSIYTSSMYFLAFGIVFFCPMLTVSCVAGDRERKIWYDLINSPLSGWSILMGKMAGRLATVFSWVISILPVWAILGLVGGLDPALVLVGFVMMIAYGWFYAAIGLFASTVTSRTRDAIALSTAITASILLFPLIRINWIGIALNPIFTIEFQRLFNQNSGFKFWLDPRLIVLSIMSLGPLLTWFSGLILRPVSLRMERIGTCSEKVKLQRTFASNAQGDAFIKSDDALGFRAIWYSPMAIKERKVRMGSRLVGRFVKLVIFAFVFLAGFHLLEYASFAFIEMLAFGYQSVQSTAREDFAQKIFNVSGVAHLALMQALTIDVGGRLTAEKESDTWPTLLSTPIAATEICYGKAMGALWNWRLLFGFLLVCWTIGTLTGALNPLLVMIAICVWMVHILLALAMGLMFGVNSRNFQSMLFKATTFWVTVQFLLPLVFVLAYDEIGFIVSPALFAAYLMNPYETFYDRYYGVDLAPIFGTFQVLILWFIALRLAVRSISRFDELNGRIVRRKRITK